MLADAALRLAALTGDDAHRRIAETAIRPLLAPAMLNPIGFGATLAIAQRLVSPLEQLVVVTGESDDGVTAAARTPLM